MLMLALLIGGSPQAWARDKHFTWDHTNVSDDGGGVYRFRGEGTDVFLYGVRKWKPEDNGYFNPDCSCINIHC